MKLRNKLILSCAALAAVATTAVSTTFAWYTSNTKVQANDVQGQSAAAGNDMLLIANGLHTVTTGTGTSATTSIAEITSSDDLVFTSEVEVLARYVGGGLTNGRLMPSAYTDAGYLENQTDAIAGTAGSGTTEAAASYLEFVLYLKNQGTHAGTVTMKIDSLANANTLANLTPFPVLGTADQNLGQYIFGGSHTYSEGETYKIDICRALGMDLTSQKTTSATDLTLAGSPSETAYDISPAATLLTDNFADVAGGALSYYNGVVEAGDRFTGSAPDTLTDYVTTTGITSIAIDASEASLTKLNFKIFLNGWADACFDACQGQTFNFNLKFEFVRS